MRIILPPIPYHINAAKPRWSWRIHQWGIVWRERCECDTQQGCILVEQERRWKAEPMVKEPDCERTGQCEGANAHAGVCDCADEHERWLAEELPEVCDCAKRPPHTHTWIGHLGSKPIFW